MTFDDRVWYYTTFNNMTFGPVSMRDILNLVSAGQFHLQTAVGLSRDMSQMVPLITLIRGAAQQNAQVQQRSPQGRTLLELSKEAHPYVEEVIWWAQSLGTFVLAMRNLVPKK